MQGPTLGKPNSWKSPGVGVGNRKSQNILGDRLVPSRSTTDYDVAHHKMTSEESSDDQKVLSYKNAQIVPPREAYVNSQKAVYSATMSSHKKPTNRFIPTSADRVLDAPGLLNDYCKYSRLVVCHVVEKGTRLTKLR